MDTNILSLLISLLLSIVALASAYKGEYGPRFIYSLVWSVVHGIIGLNFMEYYPIRDYALWLLVMGHFSFLTGAQIGHWGTVRNASFQIMRTSPYRPYLLFGLIFVAFLIGLYLSREYYGTANVIAIIRSDNYRRSVILKIAEEALLEGHRASSLQGLGGALLLLATVWNSLFFFIHQGSRPKVFWALSLLNGLCVLQYALITAAKAPIINNFLALICVFFVILGHQSKLRLKRSTLKKTFVTGLALIVVIFGAWQINYRLTDQRHKVGERPVILSTALYISGSTIAFSEVLSKGPHSEYSVKHTLTFLFKWLKRFKVVQADRSADIYKEYLYTPYFINTYTWFYSFYSDLGPIGVTVFPFLIGFIAELVLFRVRTKGNIAWTYLYTQLWLAITTSFFAWRLTSASSYLLVALLFFIQAIPWPRKTRSRHLSNAVSNLLP